MPRTLAAGRPVAAAHVEVGVIDRLTEDGRGAYVEVAGIAPGFVVGPARFPDRLAPAAPATSSALSGGNAHTHRAERALARRDVVAVGFIGGRTDRPVILERLT